MTDAKSSLLSARYPHVEPVDPSLTSFFVNEGYIGGYIDIAMLTLVLYNACYVVIFCFVQQRQSLIGITTHSDNAR